MIQFRYSINQNRHKNIPNFEIINLGKFWDYLFGYLIYNQTEIFHIFQISQLLMIATQRVERNTVVPLQQAFSASLGIACINSYLYVFYSNTIRVYEQFPHKIIPQLCEEFIISQGKIVHYAINQKYIAMLFQDSKVEVRLREYWQKVQYSVNLPQKSNQINKLTLSADKIIYRYLCEGGVDCYGFITICSNKKLNTNLKQSGENGQKRLTYWVDENKCDKVVHLTHMGNLQYFYLGLKGNQIRFGMYYQNDKNTESKHRVNKQFQFGKIVESEHKLQTFTMLKVQRLKETKIQQCEQSWRQQSQGYTYYLVKIIADVDKHNKLEAQETKKSQNIRSINIKTKKTLMIKYRIFYQDKPITQNNNRNKNINQINQGQQKDNSPNSEKIQQDYERIRLQKYQKMMNTLLQIHHNDYNVGLSKSKEQSQILEGRIAQTQINDKVLQIQLFEGEKYVSCLQKQESFSVSTNKRVFLLSFKNQIKPVDKETEMNCQQVCQFDRNYKLIEVCQNKFYLSENHLCVYQKLQQNNYKIKQSDQVKQNNQTHFNKQGQNQLIGTEQLNHKIKVQTNDQYIQTQQLSDVLLEQIEQKHLSQMMDDLFHKKKVFDIQTQTLQPQLTISQQKQTPNQGQIQSPKFAQIKIQETKKQLIQKSIGNNLPICPHSHHESISKIQNKITELHSVIYTKTMHELKNIIKQQQKQAKTQILRKLQQITNNKITSTVIPLVQAHVDNIFSIKLNQVNVYIYSLAMNNLLQLKQEIEKQQIKQNMYRNELIKRELHQVMESKKAVAQMVEVCKKRQLQKIVFFQEVKKKFAQIQNKVITLQDKLKQLIQGQLTNEGKIFDEIQVIKLMLKNESRKLQQPGPTIRKKSTVILGKKQQINGDIKKQHGSKMEQQDLQQSSMIASSSQFSQQKDQDESQKQIESLSQEQASSEEQSSQYDDHMIHMKRNDRKVTDFQIHPRMNKKIQYYNPDSLNGTHNPNPYIQNYAQPQYPQYQVHQYSPNPQYGHLHHPYSNGYQYGQNIMPIYNNPYIVQPPMRSYAQQPMPRDYRFYAQRGVIGKQQYTNYQYYPQRQIRRQAQHPQVVQIKRTFAKQSRKPKKQKKKKEKQAKKQKSKSRERQRQKDNNRVG